MILHIFVDNYEGLSWVGMKYRHNPELPQILIKLATKKTDVDSD